MSGRTSTVALLVDFLERLLEDRSRGRVRTLAEYQSSYPGLETEVEREYRHVLEVETSPTGEGGERPPPEARRIRYGKFETIRELGSGGQGIVYLARHVRLDKCVALKVLAREQMAEEDILRFEREAKLAAQIDHPGLCPVFDFGFEEGTAYLAMQFVPGTTLADEIEERRHSLEESSHASERARIHTCIALIEDVARALHVAHEVGIVHRDIKPSNIVVRPDGRPVVLDFGIARRVDPDKVDGGGWGETIFGTPPYMAPEQFVPEAIPADRRVDVFALGAVLYELVTLQRAFPGPLQRGADGRPLRSDPEDPRRVLPVVDRDLSVIISTALARERADRYLTALDLAEDLRAVLETRPIRARAPSLVHRCRRWTQRNPGLAASIAALFLTLAIGLVVSLVLLGVTRAAQAALVWENYKTLIFAANLSLQNEDTASAREHLLDCPPHLRGIEWDRLWLLADSAKAVLPAGGHVDELVRYQNSANRFGALVDGSLRTFDLDDAAVSTNGQSNRLIKIRGLSGGRILAEEIAGRDHQLQIWDSGFHRVAAPVPLRGRTAALAATGDGSRIAYSDRPGEIVLLRGSERSTISEPTDDRVKQLEFSAGGDLLAVVFDGSDNPVIVYDTNRPSRIKSIRGVERHVRAFTFTPDGLRLVVATSDLPRVGSVVVSVWDLVSETALAHFPEHIRSVTKLLVHPEGDVFVGTREGGVHWLSSDLRERLGVLRGHTDAIGSMILDTSGRWLLTSSADGSVRIWSTARPIESHVLEWPSRAAKRQKLWVAFDASGDRLVAGEPNGLIEVWDLASAESPRQFLARDATTVGFVRKGTEVAYMGFGNDAVLHTVSLNDEPSRPLFPPDVARGAGPTILDGVRSRIIFARGDGRVRIRHFDDSGRARDLEGELTNPRLLAVSHDGNRIAAVTKEGFHVWDLAEGTRRDIPAPIGLRQPLPNTGMLALDRHGRMLAAAQPGSGAVLLYDLEAGGDEPEILPHLASVRAITFSPTDPRLAVATADDRVHLWDYVRRVNLLSMAGEATMLTFSPQGDRLAAAAAYAGVHLWELRQRRAPQLGSKGRAQARNRQASLTDRLRRTSKLIPRLAPETIVSSPFLPQEWYELTLEALSPAWTSDDLYDGPQNLGHAHLRLRNFGSAEAQLRLANERAEAKYGGSLPVAIEGLVRSQMLRGDSAGAQATLDAYGALPQEYWETHLLIGSPDAVQAYDYVQQLTLRSRTLQQARAEQESNRDLPSPVRTVALELLARAQERPALYHAFAWLYAMTPGLDRGTYGRAEAWARRALELETTTRHRLTLAAILYRSGNLERCLLELEDMTPNSELETLIHTALQSLCQFSLRDEEGWQSYNQFVILAQSPQFRRDRDVIDLRAEIEHLMPVPPWR